MNPMIGTSDPAADTAVYTYLQVHEKGTGRMVDPHFPPTTDRLEAKLVYREKVPANEPPMAILERAWETHNRGDRPRPREIRSMCIGDMIYLHGRDRGRLYVCRTIGWGEITDREILAWVLPAQCGEGSTWDLDAERFWKAIQEGPEA